MHRKSEKHVRVNWPRACKSTLAFFLPAIALLGCITAVVLFATSRSEMKATQAKELHTVKLQQRNVDADILQVTSDLAILAHAKILDRLWDAEGNPVPAVLAELEASFLNFATQRKLYDQIRLLDADGMEIARVNYNSGHPAIVPDEKLQNKKGRYYFDDALVLNRKEIFVSPLDLNIEHGRIEQPLKPMMRFATPVYDRQGTKRGIVLLNYFGAKLLNRLVAIVNTDEQSQPMLLNADGYWLKGPYPENEWGFMYEERKDRTFTKAFPKSWEIIQAQEDGQFEAPEGLFTFATVYPLLQGQHSSTGSGNAYAPSAKKLKREQYYWKIVSYVPAGSLTANHNNRLKYAVMILVLISVILLWGSWQRALAVEQRKQSEMDLRSAYGELEHRVEDRTRDLKKTNEKLLKEITERKKAEEERKQLQTQLNRAEKMETIGILAGGVAHDLNNILGAIVGYPDLMLDDLPDDSPLKSPVLAIKESGDRAAAIVQDLLTLARRGIAITEVVNLNTIINRYLGSREFFKLKEFHPNVTVETDLTDGLLNILGSPVHLIKVVMNLVSNAAEAMPGGGNIVITTENTYLDKPFKGYDKIEVGNYAVLVVSDDGVGISEADLKRIFEPFYTKKVMGRSGTGLGMAVVWGTVKDHKGYIDITSNEGMGTSFKLYFPVTRKDLKGKEKPVPIDEYVGNGEMILVIDDVQSQREIASNILRKLGYAVTAVSSGEEAVKYLKNNSADLLLLDMIMDPGIDGFETYKRILEIHPAQKAIIVSGFSETDRVKEVQKLGAGAYVKKPYTLEKIGIIVKAELQKQF